MLHSDQGNIYTVKQFQMYTKEKGIITSMFRKGNCHDNALIERFFGNLKTEAVYLQIPTKLSNTIVCEFRGN
ncbi:DDE-type integrase/transposase/recombinase [Bacillus thuringiensis serovar andalousiensis]|uniref:DDE-type integrase/transposase/recombinase n=1 Tax=Bacillus thuringiensis serovar andalousiensis TaxID=257985 RepID=A0A6H0TSG1_BACTU|nr:DDE-type integrase/transposase/recombinase [Bacillus thuringiensis serovar andalousiensis]